MNEHADDARTAAEASDEESRAMLHVRLFSVLREKVGSASVAVEVEGPISGAALLDRLSEEHPAIAAYRSVLRLAVEEEYAPEHARIRPDDEVALLTPVSGG